MGNTILCTIDFSQSSRQAVRWAATMAQQLKVHLTVLYTYRLIHVPAVEVMQLKKRIEEEARRQFDSLEKEILMDKGISYDFKIEIGFVSDRIEDHMKKNSLNFLVIDKNISTNSKDTFDELLEHIHVPTLVVP